MKKKFRGWNSPFLRKLKESQTIKKERMPNLIRKTRNKYKKRNMRTMIAIMRKITSISAILSPK